MQVFLLFLDCLSHKITVCPKKLNALLWCVKFIYDDSRA